MESCLQNGRKVDMFVTALVNIIFYNCNNSLHIILMTCIRVNMFLKYHLYNFWKGELRFKLRSSNCDGDVSYIYVDILFMICTGPIKSIEIWLAQNLLTTGAHVYIRGSNWLWASANFLANSLKPVPSSSRNQAPQEKENICLQNKHNKIARKQMLISITSPWLNSLVKVKCCSQLGICMRNNWKDYSQYKHHFHSCFFFPPKCTFLSLALLFLCS